MSLLRSLLLVACVAGAWFLVTGQWHDQMNSVSYDEPTISALAPHREVTVATAPEAMFALQAIPPQRGPSQESCPLGDTYVPPAWGLLGVTILLFLYFVSILGGEIIF